MIVLALAGLFVLLSVVSNVRASLEEKKLADARRRESMRKVTENWHFREWEEDLRSSDSL